MHGSRIPNDYLKKEGEAKGVKKKRLRDMTWEDYGISKHRYNELKAFCLQYEEKKNKIKRGLSGISYERLLGGAGTGNPTEQAAMKNAMYQKDCEMIEQAAVAAGSEIYPYIIKSVTENLPYRFIEYDNKLGKIPMGKTEFYARKKLFFHILDNLTLGIKG